MSMNLDVLAALDEIGIASCDDIAPNLPEYTRDQIKQSLQNLRFMGRVRIVVPSRGLGEGGGKSLAKYAVALQRPVLDTPTVRPVSSIWELGTRALQEAQTC